MIDKNGCTKCGSNKYILFNGLGGMLFCGNCEPELDDNYQPERSKREDTCKHEYGSSDFQDNPILESYECNKCGYVMRCSEHCGNTVREVQ